MKLSELMSKKVVTITDGKDIGTISDAILTNDLKIVFIIVCIKPRGLKRFCPFLFEPECEKISVDCIVSVGIDVILVKRSS